MIEVRDLCYHYPHTRDDVLNHIDLSIGEGSFTVIMGSNGSGKSTLARCLNGLLIPTTGTVIVDGARSDDPVSRFEMRRKVGLVFQDPNLQMTSATIERELAFGLENIRMNPDEMHARVGEYLKVFGFEHRRGDSPASLSAGERQRLAVASVMILKPSYLLLDEATSLLAMKSRMAIMAMVTELRRQHKIAVIQITQYPSEALLGERLVVLHEGNIVMDDTPEHVFRHGATLLQLGVPIPMRERLKVAV